MTNEEFIAQASEVLKPHRTTDDRLIGNVGAAVLSAQGRIFTGVCVDTPGWGLCAERAALAAMITAGEYRAERIVAVWRDETGKLYVLPPCGICREFLRAVDEGNLETEIVLGPERSATLRKLLPHHEWPDPIG